MFALTPCSKHLTGKVDEITPEIDPQTRSQQLKVSLPKVAGLQQGQFGWLDLACQAEQPALIDPRFRYRALRPIASSKSR